MPKKKLSYWLINFKQHTANSPFVLPHIAYSKDGENFLFYQRNSCCVIISFILMNSLTEVLILQ